MVSTALFMQTHNSDRQSRGACVILITCFVGQYVKWCIIYEVELVVILITTLIIQKAAVMINSGLSHQEAQHCVQTQEFKH